MSIAIVIAGLVTVLYGFSILAVGCLMVMANSETGWGLDRLGWAGVGFQVVGLAFLVIGISVAGGVA